MELSLKDRLVLHNQYRILEKLYPEEADRFHNLQTALECGYALHYGDAVEFFSDGLTEDECREVLDVLNMFRALTFGYKALADKSGIDPQEIKFRGYDGNEEGRQMGYVRYFIKDLGRFDELADNTFNSHAPMRERYARMVTAWQECADRYELSKDDIVRILAAA